jgi:hypothetical protein
MIDHMFTLYTYSEYLQFGALLSLISIRRDSKCNLSKVLLIPLILVRLLDLVQRKDLGVDDGLDVVRLNGPVHLLKLLSTPNVNTPHRADRSKGFQHGRLFFSLDPAEETDDADDPVETDGLEGLGHGVGSTDLKDMLDPTIASDLFGSFTPVLVFLVVDNVVGTEGFHTLGFFGRRGSRDDFGSSGFGELTAATTRTN